MSLLRTAGLERSFDALRRGYFNLGIQHLALLVENEVAAVDAHVGPAVALFLAPHTVDFGHFVVEIRQEGEIQLVFGAEFLKLLDRVRADADDDGVVLLEN